jgi:hypothetical protein
MPLKRHPALQDYSREHHDELLLVWKIREGLRRGISPDRIISYIIHHFNQETLFHMMREEEYILKKLEDDDLDKIKILNEHAHLKELVSKLENESADQKQLIIDFADALEKHIRYEERMFFPKLQHDFSDEALIEMKPTEPTSSCAPWEDSFWETGESNL